MSSHHFSFKLYGYTYACAVCVCVLDDFFLFLQIKSTKCLMVPHSKVTINHHPIQWALDASGKGRTRAEPTGDGWKKKESSLLKSIAKEYANKKKPAAVTTIHHLINIFTLRQIASIYTLRSHVVYMYTPHHVHTIEHITRKPPVYSDYNNNSNNKNQKPATKQTIIAEWTNIAMNNGMKWNRYYFIFYTYKNYIYHLNIILNRGNFKANGYSAAEKSVGPFTSTRSKPATANFSAFVCVCV